jgi:hypothetical protein
VFAVLAAPETLQREYAVPEATLEEEARDTAADAT